MFHLYSYCQILFLHVEHFELALRFFIIENNYKPLIAFQRMNHSNEPNEPIEIGELIK